MFDLDQNLPLVPWDRGAADALLAASHALASQVHEGWVLLTRLHDAARAGLSGPEGEAFDREWDDIRRLVDQLRAELDVVPPRIRAGAEAREFTLATAATVAGPVSLMGNALRRAG